MLKNGYTTTLRVNTSLQVTKVTILAHLPTTPIDTIQPKQINLKHLETPPKKSSHLKSFYQTHFLMNHMKHQLSLLKRKIKWNLCGRFKGVG
jgi:hypothetical protein